MRQCFILLIASKIEGKEIRFRGIRRSKRPYLEHDDTNASHLGLVGEVLVVDSTRNRRSTVIVEVEMQLTITGAELEFLKEQRVVVRSKGVEDVETGLNQKLVQ
jgi:hypothetical protein